MILDERRRPCSHAAANPASAPMADQPSPAPAGARAEANQAPPIPPASGSAYAIIAARRTFSGCRATRTRSPGRNDPWPCTASDQVSGPLRRRLTTGPIPQPALSPHAAQVMVASRRTSTRSRWQPETLPVRVSIPGSGRARRRRQRNTLHRAHRYLAYCRDQVAVAARGIGIRSAHA